MNKLINTLEQDSSHFESYQNIHALEHEEILAVFLSPNADTDESVPLEYRIRFVYSLHSSSHKKQKGKKMMGKSFQHDTSAFKRSLR